MTLWQRGHFPSVMFIDLSIRTIRLSTYLSIIQAERCFQKRMRYNKNGTEE